MPWYLILAACLVAYVLGMAVTWAYTRGRGPNRRVEDRRKSQRRAGERRQSEETADVELREADRRSGDRRGGERRRNYKKTQILTVVVSVLVLSGIGAVSYAEQHVGSFFGQDQPSLRNSGWANCQTPITWSLDTSRLTGAQAKAARKLMTRDFAKWGAASGLKFTYAGEIPTVYNDTSYTVTSGTHPSGRHIYVTFLNRGESSLLDARTVGFAQPSLVYQSRKEIVEGSVVLSADYIATASTRQQTSLYLHELGHALGLGHAPDKNDVMYKIVTDRNELSPDDIAGIKALTKVCPAG